MTISDVHSMSLEELLESRRLLTAKIEELRLEQANADPLVHELIREAIDGLNTKSYIRPSSDFRVGAAIRTTADIYPAGNHEFKGRKSICAEQSCIVQIPVDELNSIVAIAIVGSTDGLTTPCGTCRQALAEHATPDIPAYMANESGKLLLVSTIGELFPHAWSRSLN
jgi:cytidine deaminase